MGLFDRLLGRQKRTNPPSDNDEGTPLELASAVSALERGDWSQVVKLARPYRDSPQKNLRSDAYRLCALATGRLEQWETAFACWLALFELEPTAHNALQLASTSVMAKEVECGKAWLMKFDEINENSHELPVATAYTNFISALAQAGHAEETLPYLSWLRELYRHLKVTDDTFLYMRGVPFLSVFLDNSWPLLSQCLDKEQIQDWYGSMLSDLDEGGCKLLRGWLDERVFSIDGDV